MSALRDSDSSSPLALFYQVVDHDSETIIHSLERLDLRVQTFYDPRRFLLNLRKLAPAVCFIDLSTPKTDFALALIRTMRHVLGQNPPIIALVGPDGGEMKERLKDAAVISFVEKPVSRRALARQLSAHVATDAIARLLSGAAAAAPAAGGHSSNEELPAVVSWHLEEVRPRLTELGGVLEVHDDAEKQLKYYAERLTACAPEIIEMVSRLRKTEEKLDLVQSLRLYGVESTRNLVVARSLARLTDVKFGFNPKTQLLSEDPKKIIPYAVRAVAHFGEGTRYQEVAFNSGLLFDLLYRLASGAEDRKRALHRTIENGFSDALSRADRGFKLGRQTGDLALEKHLISALLVSEAARVAMAICYPQYQALVESFGKKAVKGCLQHVIEQDRFGISRGLVAALLAQATPALLGAWRACLFADLPFMLGRTADEGDSGALARLCQSL